MMHIENMPGVIVCADGHLVFASIVLGEEKENGKRQIRAIINKFDINVCNESGPCRSRVYFKISIHFVRYRKKQTS